MQPGSKGNLLYMYGNVGRLKACAAVAAARSTHVYRADQLIAARLFGMRVPCAQAGPCPRGPSQHSGSGFGHNFSSSRGELGDYGCATDTGCEMSLNLLRPRQYISACHESFRIDRIGAPVSLTSAQRVATLVDVLARRDEFLDASAPIAPHSRTWSHNRAES